VVDDKKLCNMEFSISELFAVFNAIKIIWEVHPATLLIEDRRLEFALLKVLGGSA